MLCLHNVSKTSKQETISSKVFSKHCVGLKSAQKWAFSRGGSLVGVKSDFPRSKPPLYSGETSGLDGASFGGLKAVCDM